LAPSAVIALDDATIIDYAADGSVVRVEFISPSRGVNLAGVPHAAEIERERLRRSNARFVASACPSERRRPTSCDPANSRLTRFLRPGRGRPARQAAESLISSV
jgi:hypothetical protein